MVPIRIPTICPYNLVPNCILILQKWIKTLSYHYKQGKAYLNSNWRSCLNKIDKFFLYQIMGLCCVQKMKNHTWTNSSPRHLYYSVYLKLHQNFLKTRIYFSLIVHTWYFITIALIALRQEMNNFEKSVVVQELEFAIDLALYSLLCSLGNQYIVGRLSWRSLTFTENLLQRSII